MGRLLKRAAVVAETALKEGATTCPDAIFSGTGLGCVESTEKFLETLCREGEHLLSPAHFMGPTRRSPTRRFLLSRRSTRPSCRCGLPNAAMPSWGATTR